MEFVKPVFGNNYWTVFGVMEVTVGLGWVEVGLVIGVVALGTLGEALSG